MVQECGLGLTRPRRKRLRLMIERLIECVAQRALLNFPHKIGSNEPEPVRITTKRREPETCLLAVDSGPAKTRRTVVANGDEMGRGRGSDVFQIGHHMMPAGEQLLVS
ncbi:hypothetical protein OIU84_003861 [Salix udensis]|uniref:Uncharacterized protein n=1 Tax=Salix udensis TaxID=889485 RepID=A0AAD6P330_9ROSI|nr:hypothetical protein OIU84_003861 [Salix udensis]